MRRIGVVAACLVLLASPACTRRAATDPTTTEPDPAARWYVYALATGERHYELRIRLKGTVRLGEGFVQVLTALAPTTSVPPPPERDLPVDADLTASLAAAITPAGEDRLVTMTYERLTGRIDVGGVRSEVGVAGLAVARGGATTFTYRMAPDGSVEPAPTAAATTTTTTPSDGAIPTEIAPSADTPPASQSPAQAAALDSAAKPVPRGLDLSCPHPPPGGADPRQSWKIAERLPLLGAAGTGFATNTYTLEGDNSAVVSSRIDTPLDSTVDLGLLGAANPVLGAIGGASGPAAARLGGSITMTTTCELTWPEQELLARTLQGHQRLLLSFPASVGPPSASLAPGQFLVLDLDVDSELRSV